MKMTAALFGLIAISILTVAGCGKENASDDKSSAAKSNGNQKPSANGEKSTPQKNATSTTATGPKKQVPVKTPAQSGEITAKVLSWDETQELVKQHKGKVVVLDYWTTSCEPCVRELPGLAALQNKHRGDVAAISLSLDFFGDGESPSQELQYNVLAELRRINIGVQNVICSDPDDSIYNKRVSFISVPAVAVYDQTGKLRKTFTNEKPGRPEFTYEKDVAPFVEKLIAGEADK